MDKPTKINKRFTLLWHAKKFFFAGSLCLALLVQMDFAIADNVMVFTIINRDANEIKDSIQSFLAKDAVVKVDQNKIIIQSDADNLKNIKNIIDSLDVAKKQLKLTIYWGENPEANKDSTVISINKNETNNLQTLYVEDGESVSVSQASLVKLVKSSSGSQQQQKLQSTNTSRNVDGTIAVAAADMVSQIAQARVGINQQQTNIADLQNQLATARAQNNFAQITALSGQITAANRQLENAQQILAGLEEKQRSLNNNIANTKDKQTNYTATANAGGIAEDFINLPEGIYIKPKILNANKLKVEVNIVKADSAINKAFNKETKKLTKEIKTTLQISANKWQQLAGESTKLANEQVITYSTDSFTNDKKLWIKIEFVD